MGAVTNAENDATIPVSSSHAIAGASATARTATIAVHRYPNDRNASVLLPRTASRATTVCNANAGTASTNWAASRLANSP